MASTEHVLLMVATFLLPTFNSYGHYLCVAIPLLLCRYTALWASLFTLFRGALLHVAVSNSYRPAGEEQPLEPAPQSVNSDKGKGKGRDSHERRNKRRRWNNQEDSDEDYERQHAHAGDFGGAGREQESSGRFMACPFYKLDPHRYHRCAGKYELKKFADVKQHLQRCHLLGNYYCHNCWDTWKEPGPWQEHTRSLICQELTGPEKFLPREEEILKATPRTLSEKDKWYWVWDKLFKDHARPASPYLEDGFSEPAGVLYRNVESVLAAFLPSIFVQHNVQLSHTTDMPMLISDIASQLRMPYGGAQIFRLYPNGAARPQDQAPQNHVLQSLPRSLTILSPPDSIPVTANMGFNPYIPSPVPGPRLVGDNTNISLQSNQTMGPANHDSLVNSNVVAAGQPPEDVGNTQSFGLGSSFQPFFEENDDSTSWTDWTW